MKFLIGLINELNQIKNPELKIFINDIVQYLNEFDNFGIDEIDEFSIYLKKFNKKVKKMELSDNEKNKIIFLINDIIEFNNDLLMTIIMSNI